MIADQKIPPNCECQDLKKHRLFWRLTRSQIRNLSSAKNVYSYKLGENIISQGDFATGLYCIHIGKVKVYYTDSDGIEQTIRLAKTGDALGFRSLLKNEPHKVSAEALADSLICFIPKDKFMEVMGKDNNLIYKDCNCPNSNLKKKMYLV